jgi:hypothetical protein
MDLQAVGRAGMDTGVRLVTAIMSLVGNVPNTHLYSPTLWPEQPILKLFRYLGVPSPTLKATINLSLVLITTLSNQLNSLPPKLLTNGKEVTLILTIICLCLTT